MPVSTRCGPSRLPLTVEQPARVPDDHPVIFPHRAPERIDTSCDQDRYRCVAWQIARLRWELIHAAVWGASNLYVTAIVGIEMWWRYVSACNSNNRRAKGTPDRRAKSAAKAAGQAARFPGGRRTRGLPPLSKDPKIRRAERIVENGLEMARRKKQLPIPAHKPWEELSRGQKL
jgi:hypothetical protein